MQNKVIAVWGNPNSGKTVNSIKLAVELSKQKKNVVLVFCDSIVPTLSSVLPFEDTKNRSLGELLSSPQVTQESILESSILIDKNPYLSVLGYLHGENERSYAKYSKERVVDLFILLKHLADYVVIDCSSYFSNDILSRTGLELSDQVIRLITPDLKAISYYDSSLPMIAERKYNFQNHLKIISSTKAMIASDHVSNRFGGVNLEFPYTSELETQKLEGELFSGLTEKESQKYQKILMQTVLKITDEDENQVKEKKKMKLPFMKTKEKGDDFNE